MGCSCRFVRSRGVLRCFGLGCEMLEGFCHGWLGAVGMQGLGLVVLVCFVRLACVERVVCQVRGLN